MGEFDARGVSTTGGCFVSRSATSSCRLSGFCATSEGAELDDNEGAAADAGGDEGAAAWMDVGADALNRVPTEGVALVELEEREADPRRYSFRNRDRHSSQNTADASHGLLQRKHWLICNSSHLPGREPDTRTRLSAPPPPLPRHPAAGTTT